MRVLVVTPWFPTGESDYRGIFVRDQVLALSRQGHEVRVVHVMVKAGPTATWCEEETYRSLAVLRLHVTGGSPHLHQLRVCRGLWRQARTWAARGFRPDVIHGHTDRVAVAAMTASVALRVPYGITEHSSEWVDPATPFPDGRRRWIGRFAMGRADFVIAVSSFLGSGLRDQLGVRALVVPNSVAGAFFDINRRSADSSPRLVSVGACVPEKDFDLLLRAFEVLLRDRPNVTLTVVGDGALLPQHRALAADLGVQDRVEFIGRRSREEVASLLQTASAFVSTSRVETFGVAIAEAMAAGIPVVATASGGPEEMITPEVGVLVRDRSPERVAVAMQQVLDISWSSDRIRDYARRKWSADSVAAELFNIYSRAAAGAQQSSKARPRRR